MSIRVNGHGNVVAGGNLKVHKQKTERGEPDASLADVARGIALIAFVVAIATCHQQALHELPFVPIKLSQLGRGVAYRFFAAGMAATGLCLLCFHYLRGTSKVLWVGDLCAALIGIINSGSGWVRWAHLLPVAGTFGCYWYYLWVVLARPKWVRLAIGFCLLEAALALLNRFMWPGDPFTFIGSALCQYTAILLSAGPVILL